MATLRQTRANRENAKNSTGPTSTQGKIHSRANALKHGLAGAGVVAPPADESLIAERLVSWRPSYNPEGKEQEWLFNQLILSSVRIDRCQRDEAALRAHQSDRATLCWNDDRALDAETLGASLAQRPERTAASLRRTRQGCEWLLDRLHALDQILKSKGEWTEPQKSLALDLLGTPKDLRDLDRDTAQPHTLLAQEIASLEALKSQALDDLDLFEQSAAEQGLDLNTSKPLALLRRYEASCLKRFQWARKQLLNHSPAPVFDTPSTKPRPEPIPQKSRHFERALPEPPPVFIEKPLSIPAPTKISPPKPSPRPLNRRQRRAVSKLQPSRS